jgi:site-specific DNA-cytosine methylase
MEKLPSVDALAFGFPCNDFSDVGEKKASTVFMDSFTYTA